jgi:hypothetical protein
MEIVAAESDERAEDGSGRKVVPDDEGGVRLEMVRKVVMVRRPARRVVYAAPTYDGS